MLVQNTYDGWQLFLDTCCSVCLFSQIAMRGPPGPMGLTGRPGPVVCRQNWGTGLRTH